ncbi:hypothetical protein M2451_002840 [Dysgonomonas sp. PFB1-18]|nr:hypothetical protein [Dysgonomonas sp. PF1-14]MDH6339859.1 hypothetical protein [Dysgonomonas sp. PF1-16]MDH6381507.1 hypothetical protein [Dysgonomonas sp. PFB1-18]MDH6398857.1 hypothetical protein [Dysgonomonas sp. PF1-23]
MEIVCIDASAWELLKRQIGRLTFEVKALRELYCSNPRDG